MQPIIKKQAGFMKVCRIFCAALIFLSVTSVTVGGNACCRCCLLDIEWAGWVGNHECPDIDHHGIAIEESL